MENNFKYYKQVIVNLMVKKSRIQANTMTFAGGTKQMAAVFS